MTISPSTPLIITSDVHIGSPHFRENAFLNFLKHLPDEVGLVLNGDTIDRPEDALARPHAQILDALQKETEKRRVILIEGNHDGFSAKDGIPAADCAEEVLMPGRLIVLHGHQIDEVMPAHRHFIRLFRRFHALRVLLGAPDVHVAEYAKKWRLAYRILVRRQRHNGIQYAREQNVNTVVCGHVHSVEDTTQHGIRYLNTGSWTEAPTYCVRVLPDSIEFVNCDEIAGTASPESA